MGDSFRVFSVDSNPVNSKAVVLALNSIGIEVDCCSSYRNAAKTISKNGSDFSMIFFGMNFDLDNSNDEEMDVVRSSSLMLIPYLTAFQKDSDYVKFSSFANCWKGKNYFIDSSISFNLKGNMSSPLLWYKIWDYILVGFHTEYPSERCVNNQRSFLPKEWDEMMENKRKIYSSPFNIGFITLIHKLRKSYREYSGKELNCETKRDKK